MIYFIIITDYLRRISLYIYLDHTQNQMRIIEENIYQINKQSKESQQILFSITTRQYYVERIKDYD